MGDGQLKRQLSREKLGWTKKEIKGNQFIAELIQNGLYREDLVHLLPGRETLQSVLVSK